MSLSRPSITMLPLALALAAFLGHASGLVVEGQGAHSLRARSVHPAKVSHAVLAAKLDSMVKPLHFDQSLLVCNAYPSESPVLVKKNGQEDEGRPIGFGECRNVSSNIQAHDKLDFNLRDVEIHGSFEIGEELPSSDAVLLLVLGKRADSELLSFQSLALPTSLESREMQEENGAAKDQEARLAIIDAYRGNSTSARLKMQDHITSKEEQTVSKRVEELSFDRVYSIEPGQYDLSVVDRRGGSHGLAPFGAAGSRVEAAGPKLMTMAPSQNYVVIRTGTAETGEFPERLFVFPDTLPRSEVKRSTFATWWAEAMAAFSAAKAAVSR